MIGVHECLTQQYRVTPDQTKKKQNAQPDKKSKTPDKTKISKWLKKGLKLYGTSITELITASILMGG
jgi:hypothetical protein